MNDPEKIYACIKTNLPMITEKAYSDCMKLWKSDGYRLECYRTYMKKLDISSTYVGMKKLDDLIHSDKDLKDSVKIRETYHASEKKGSFYLMFGNKIIKALSDRKY